VSIADAFRPAENHYRQQVLAETWGHLAPRKNKKYKGRIVIAVGCYGNDHLNPTVLIAEFEDLDDSPWFFDALQEFIQDGIQFDSGQVIEWKGSFRNYRFEGTQSLLLDTNSR